MGRDQYKLHIQKCFFFQILSRCTSSLVGYQSNRQRRFKFAGCVCEYLGSIFNASNEMPVRHKQ